MKDTRSSNGDAMAVLSPAFLHACIHLKTITLEVLLLREPSRILLFTTSRISKGSGFQEEECMKSRFPQS